MSSQPTKNNHKTPSSSPFIRLLLCALVTGLIYLTIFTLPFLLTKFYNTIPPVDYAKLTNHSAGGFWRYLFGMVALFDLYIWAIRLTAPQNAGEPSTPHNRRLLWIGAASFAVILFFSYPVTAIDLFIYAIRTRGWALYNLPPLATPPEVLPAADPWLGLAGEWVDAASPYGPLWEGLSLAAFYLSGGNFLAHLFALKLIAVAAYLGCTWFVYQILVQLRPKWAIAGTLAFAWNPLVLFESAQNGHNDIVMVFFLLAAVWAVVRLWQMEPAGRHFHLWAGLACLLLAFSILVKFVTIVAVPFFLLALAGRHPDWPRRVAWLLLYGVITLAVVAGFMLPVWPGLENWAVPQAGSQAGRSLLALLVLGLRDSLGTNAAFDVSRNLILAGVGLIYLYYLGQLILPLFKSWGRSAAPLRLISATFFVLFWYVLLAAPVFHAWYLLWFLPLAPLLLPRQKALAAAIVFSIAALLAIPYFETIRVWYPPLLNNQFLGHLIGVPLLILPPMLTLLRPIRLTPKFEV